MLNNLLADVSSNTALVNDINTALTSIKAYGVIIDPSHSDYVLPNIQLTDDYKKKAIQTLLAFEKATDTCDANTNYVISLSNKILKCEGTSCPANFAGFPFNWITGNGTDFYSIYAGCANTSRFFFSSFSWEHGHYITQLRYNKGTVRYDLTQRYQQRFKQCIPGTTRNPNSFDDPCPADQLKKECKDTLDLSCKTSLNKLISTMITDNSQTKPSTCGDVNPNLQTLVELQGINQDDDFSVDSDPRLSPLSSGPDDSTLTCLKFINDNLLNNLATNISAIPSINSGALSASVISSTTTLRYLATTASMVDSSDIPTSISFDGVIIKRSEINLVFGEYVDFGITASGYYYSTRFALVVYIFLF
jgi:hypothetical protein